MPIGHSPDIGSLFSRGVLTLSREYGSVSSRREARRWKTTASLRA